MKIGDRINHTKLGYGTIVDKRLTIKDYPYLVRFDFDLFNLKWCKEEDLEKVVQYVRRIRNIR